MSGARFCFCPEHGRVKESDMRLFTKELVDSVYFVTFDPKGDPTDPVYGQLLQGEVCSQDGENQEHYWFHVLPDGTDCERDLGDRTYNEAEVIGLESKLVLGYCTQCQESITDPSALVFKQIDYYEVGVVPEHPGGKMVLARNFTHGSYGFWHATNCGGRVETELFDFDGEEL